MLEALSARPESSKVRLHYAAGRGSALWIDVSSIAARFADSHASYQLTASDSMQTWFIWKCLAVFAGPCLSGA